jgi:phenylacetic acid degradation operon negative regulatory protein
MRSVLLHHPDLSLPVLRRRATTVLLDALLWYGEFVLSRGRSAWRAPMYESRTAYWNAVRRLRRQGVIARGRRAEDEPRLHVNALDPADQALAHPERWWNRKWNGLWYVLVYDVPERNRRYRDHLRILLRRNRCGCLQGSVWVSPTDLRPLFDDLNTAANLGDMAHLFEARTVLGLGGQRLVLQAWDFNRLAHHADSHRTVCERGTEALVRGDLSREALVRWAMDEASCYRDVIAADPLLPRALHPPGYNGELVLERHLAFVRAVRLRARERERTL